MRSGHPKDERVRNENTSLLHLVSRKGHACPTLADSQSQLFFPFFVGFGNPNPLLKTEQTVPGPGQTGAYLYMVEDPLVSIRENRSNTGTSVHDDRDHHDSFQNTQPHSCHGRHVTQAFPLPFFVRYCIVHAYESVLQRSPILLTCLCAKV